MGGTVGEVIKKYKDMSDRSSYERAETIVFPKKIFIFENPQCKSANEEQFIVVLLNIFNSEILLFNIFIFIFVA